MYQHCLPQVFRYINSVADTEAEMLAISNNTRPNITDSWETMYIGSSTALYDHEKELIQSFGFDTVITAEALQTYNENLGEFDTAFGYFDEVGLDFLWKYVDNTRARVPKNRMFLAWLTTTTHNPFSVPPEWAEMNHRAYVKDDRIYDSVDRYLNAVRWTDDKVKEIILGFRERGLEDETLFLMYLPICSVH